ncbi:myo-inositol 2-dehydrogenase/D-chiro-inositol 1-dehydrogenase [Microbacterium sp. W4I4]|uniref:Gfo/Idh/MocA family protein n=1 Tax=Microbacterium sp. W4I4 TaxID=3042295 RepID=UPI0027846224|nr:Gfo/Idh/MocA family oxidoreductase [Microbacterium sp. W4I4]MDQ0614522.1 myo-inositol 2-dehydrogenase/D-chiro-inositol 1-dehydrogenase [Microbacterium sp. W4I4]
MDSTPQVGIVGAGGIAPPHIEGWLALGAEVGILRRTGADALAEQYRIRIHDSLDALLDASEIVDIVSPTPSHPDIAQAAFDRGRHVVCEKPLALTASDAQAMTDAAHAAAVRLFPAHVVRYFDGYRRLHEQRETVGRMLELTFRRTVAAPSAAWFYSQELGGGLIRDLMIHDLDQALWLAGPVAEVSATQDRADEQPPVSAHVTLTHVNGAISHVRADWFGPETPFRSQVEVVGADGALRFGTDELGGAREGYLPPASDLDPYRAQLADFLDALRTGRDARVTPEDGVAAVALVDAAYASLASGHPVVL